jgi:hypothetical protein
VRRMTSCVAMVILVDQTVLPEADNLRLSSRTHVIYSDGNNELTVNATAGQRLQLTCETGLSRPEMQLGWLINDIPVSHLSLSLFSLRRVRFVSIAGTTFNHRSLSLT